MSNPWKNIDLRFLSELALCEQGIGLAGCPLKSTENKKESGMLDGGDLPGCGASAKYAPYGADPACLFGISMDSSYDAHTRKAAATLATCAVSPATCPGGSAGQLATAIFWACDPFEGFQGCGTSSDCNRALQSCSCGKKSFTDWAGRFTPGCPQNFT